MGLALWCLVGMVFDQERYEVRNDKGNVYVYEYRNV
jgi:hypothetical protein